MMFRDAFNYPQVFNQTGLSLRVACLTAVAPGLIGIAFELVLTS